MQKARRHPDKSGLRPLVSVWFQGLFHSLNSGFFSPFPHGTTSLSVSQEYLALADGPAEFIQGSSCPVLLRILLQLYTITRTGLSPSAIELSNSIPVLVYNRYRSPITPNIPKYIRFGLIQFRSPLLSESLLFSLPIGT